MEIAYQSYWKVLCKCSIASSMSSSACVAALIRIETGMVRITAFGTLFRILVTTESSTTHLSWLDKGHVKMRHSGEPSKGQKNVLQVRLDWSTLPDIAHYPNNYYYRQAIPNANSTFETLPQSSSSFRVVIWFHPLATICISSPFVSIGICVLQSCWCRCHRE